jgi:hypothetical protein
VRDFLARRHKIKGRGTNRFSYNDVVVDTPECRPMRPIGEVARPPKQETVECIAHVQPGIVIAGRQRPRRARARTKIGDNHRATFMSDASAIARLSVSM